MPTEWREGKEKFERGYVGDDQLLRGTQERDIFFKGTPVKASHYLLLPQPVEPCKKRKMRAFPNLMEVRSIM